MKLELELEDPQELVSQAAKSQSLSVEQYCQSVLQREVTRLWHIERSKPKPRVGVGRPKDEDNTRELKQIASELRNVYLRLQEMYDPETFETGYGAQLRELDSAIQTNDLPALINMRNTQPWVRRQR